MSLTDAYVTYLETLDALKYCSVQPRTYTVGDVTVRGYSCGHKSLPDNLMAFTKQLLDYHLQAHPDDKGAVEGIPMCCVIAHIRNYNKV